MSLVRLLKSSPHVYEVCEGGEAPLPDVALMSHQ